MASSVEADHVLLGAELIRASGEGRRGDGDTQTHRLMCLEWLHCPKGSPALHTLALVQALPGPDEFRQSAATHAAEMLPEEC